MTELTGKYKRTIDILLNRLINQKSFSFPEGPKDFAVDNALVKHLRLANKQVILLTDTELAHFRNIVANIDKSDVFEGIAGYPDIWGALHGILEDLCSKEMRPDDMRLNLSN